MAETMVRLKFGRDIAVECFHAPSRSVINDGERSESMKTNSASLSNRLSPHARSAAYMRARKNEVLISKKQISRLAVVLAAISLAGSAWAVTLYDSNGFESPTFTLGGLPGQNGWTGGESGGGAVPLVVMVPDPVIGLQAVRLEVPDVQGASSMMDHAIPAINLAGSVVTVSFDVYRPAPASGNSPQNLWWWWWDAGEPTYGLQWEQGGVTLPNGWNSGAGQAATVYDRYANVTMVWDFTQMKASSWYDGAIVDDGIPIANIASLTGWTIQLAHDAATGTGASLAYIDNFSITVVPEPASWVLLALGGLLLLRRRK